MQASNLQSLSLPHHSYPLFPVLFSSSFYSLFGFPLPVVSAVHFSHYALPSSVSVTLPLPSNSVFFHIFHVPICIVYLYSTLLSPFPSVTLLTLVIDSFMDFSRPFLDGKNLKWIEGSDLMFISAQRRRILSSFCVHLTRRVRSIETWRKNCHQLPGDLSHSAA